MPTPKSVESIAESIKEEANSCYKKGNYSEAIQLYTKAIGLLFTRLPLHWTELVPSKATYYANRAAAHISLRHLREAIEDCTHSIELDCTLVKVLLCVLAL